MLYYYIRCDIMIGMCLKELVLGKPMNHVSVLFLIIINFLK